MTAAANAAPLRYDFNVVCVVDCNRIGLNDNDRLNAFFVLDSSAFRAGPAGTGFYNSVAIPDTVLDFEIVFGTVNLSPENTVDFDFSANSSAGLPTSLDFWRLSTSTSNASADPGDGVMLIGFGTRSDPPGVGGIAGPGTFCPGSQCQNFLDLRGDLSALISFGEIDRVTAVPLPASASMISAVLFLFGVFSCRKRRELRA